MNALATFVNGVENVSMAPIDFAVAPAVAARTMSANLDMAQMTGGRRVVTMTAGLPWIWVLQGVMAGARIVSGIGEMLIGLPPVSPYFIASCVTDVPERQLFDATTHSPMVNRPGAFDVVFGAAYISAQ